MMPSEFHTSVIYHCTACGQAIREVAGLANNSAAKVWSDGKEEYRSGLQEHWLVLCPHCRTPLWLDELEGYEEFVDDDDGFADLPEAGWPDLDREELPESRLNPPLDYAVPAFADYLAVLPTIRKFPEKVFELRLRAWWAGNDLRRGLSTALPLSAAEVENLEAFIGLLDAASSYEQYLKAEALRELGRFDESAAVLAHINDADMAQVRVFLNQRIEARDAIVSLLG